MDAGEAVTDQAGEVIVERLSQPYTTLRKPDKQKLLAFSWPVLAGKRVCREKRDKLRALPSRIRFADPPQSLSQRFLKPRQRIPG